MDKETIRRRAAHLLVAQDHVVMPAWLGTDSNNSFVADVRRQVTEKEWRDALYNAWRCIMEEEVAKLVSVYSVLSGEDE